VNATLAGGLAAAFAAVMLFTTTPAFADTLRIGGTGGALGGMNLLAKAFSERHPQTKVEVVAGLGSSGGIKAVLAGAIDIGVASRALRDKEREAGAVARDYAKTAFVLATRADNQTDNVTLDQLAEICQGNMVSWPDGSPVRLVLRPKTDSDTAILADLSPSIAAALQTAHGRAGLRIAPTDQDAADAIEDLPGSIGTSTLALIRAEGRAIKPLALDGVRPTAKNVQNGDYALFKTFRIVTGKKALSPIARRFVDFVWSPEGQRILSEAGHIGIPIELGS
jgi:phosphate transport system substrate-binding protein